MVLFRKRASSIMSKSNLLENIMSNYTNDSLESSVENEVSPKKKE